MAFITQEGQQEEVSAEMQERIVRLNTLSRIYELTNRVLTGDPVVVHIAPDGPAPAWSDGQSITFNAQQINETDLETLTQITGLNFHELSHHMYTPRKGTDMVKWILDNGYFQAFNMLEDQRIETLMVGRYPAVVPFLQATILRWLANTPQDLKGNYMLVRGRRYLPVKIRERFRDEFAQPELIPTIIEIADEYRTLAFPRDYKRGQELVERWHKEVLSPWQDNLPQGPGGCTGRSPVQKGRPEPGKQQEEDSAGGEGIGQAEGEFKPPEGRSEGQGQGKADQDAKGGGETDEVAPLVKEDRSTQGAEVGEDDTESDTNSGGTPKSKVGNGHAPSAHQSQELPEDLAEQINQSIQDVLNSREVQRDVRTKQKVLNGGDGRHSETIRIGKFSETDVPIEAIKHARRFAQELQRLRDDSEPTWQREVPSGRVNVQRVIRGCELDQAFDRWDEGNDSTDIEAVILIDRSGSMRTGSNDVKASIACWTIKRALHDIDAPVTVYAFDDKAEVAYKRDEKPARNKFKYINGSGGTEPYDALTAAERLFTASRKNNKILFIISDGIFDVNRNDEVIERLNRRGILTALCLITDDSTVAQYRKIAESYREQGHLELARQYELEHNAEIFSTVRTAADLIPFARSVVAGAIKKRANR